VVNDRILSLNGKSEPQFQAKNHTVFSNQN